MKASITSVLLAGLAATALAQRGSRKQSQIAEFLQADSAPNAISMAAVKQQKVDHRAEQAAAGAFDLNQYQLQDASSCTNGKAGGYSCNNVDLKGFLRHQDMLSKTLAGNDVWGWTSSTGREFGIVGQTDGTAFIEVKSDGSLVFLGRLPTQTVSSIWRDMKVIGDFVFIGAESRDHGLQIFDLSKLLQVDPKSPKTWSVTTDLAAHFKGFGSSHNIVANEATKTIFAVGTSRSLKCRGGLWMVDVSNPREPKDAGCVAEDGYVHDAQCVIYTGPHTQYKGKEICFNYNEDTLTIVDVTNRAAPKQLSRTTYNGATYTHQGWLATSDMRYLLLDDEQDEQRKSGSASDGHTATYIVEITDLTKPVFKGVYKSPVKSIDHNQYVVDGLSYQSNYGSGLRIVNVTSVLQDDTGANFEEVGFFDVYPEDDDVNGKVEFNGAWSVYPYFQSGYLLVNSIERGIFSVKHNV